MSLFVSGRNCSEVARAREAAVLVDGEAYFSAFRAAAEQARSHIYVIGWDLDYFTLLHPGVLGPFLLECLRRNRQLQVHLLTWDYSAVYVNERGLWAERKRMWQRRSRLHLCLDDVHPFGGSQHQKIVVVDDAIAFCGGIDLCQARWDRPAHRADDEQRRFHAGDPYEPFHDVQMMVSGDAAAALGNIARARWRDASGKALRAQRRDVVWPIERVDFRDVDVAIARTVPVLDQRKEVREVHQLYVDAIADAKDFIYCENQYLTSGSICSALEASLSRDEGPKIVILGPAEPTGWLEQNTMGTLRANIIDRLRKADLHGRLRLYYPEIEGRALNLHSKVMIVDDRFLRVGSSNLSNRSMGLDSECDLAIEADASALRAELLGEHLGCAIDPRVPIFEAIDRANGGARRLVRVPDPEPTLLSRVLPEEAFFDSERPMASARAVDALLRGQGNSVDRRPLMIATACLLLFVGLALAWRFSPLAQLLAPERLAGWAARAQALPFAPVLLVGTFVLASLVMVPVTLLLVQSGAIWSAPAGIGLAFLAVFVSATIGFLIGRVSSKRVLIRFAGDRWRRIHGLFLKNAVLSVAIVRAFPIAPFTVINAVAGASKCSYPAFIVGTLIGMAPGIVALVLFGRGIVSLLVAPHWGAALAIVLAVSAFVFLAGISLRGRLHAAAGRS